MQDLRRGSNIGAWTVAGTGVVLLAAGLAAAVWAGLLDEPLRATLVGITGAVTLIASTFLIASLSRGEGLAVDSHWGGLGGGIGGWRISPSILLLAVSFIFLTATFAATGADFSMEEKPATDGTGETKAGASPETGSGQPKVETGSPLAGNEQANAAANVSAANAGNAQ